MGDGLGPPGLTDNSHDRTFTGKSNGIMGCRTRSDPAKPPLWISRHFRNQSYQEAQAPLDRERAAREL